MLYKDGREEKLGILCGCSICLVAGGGTANSPLITNFSYIKASDPSGTLSCFIQ